MKIGLGFRLDWRAEKPVVTYAQSYKAAFEDLGHNVTCFGQGHSITTINSEIRRCDAIIELDCGRDSKGNFNYQVPNHPGLTAKTAVYFIDAHGHSDLYQSLAPNYQYVFYAPWIKRDIFAGHASATWLPNASDAVHFGRETSELKHIAPEFQWGFHGSKMGLTRAAPLIEVCKRLDYTYDVREVVKGQRHRWPSTPIAMRACSNLFNFGQKCDSPNLRVMESMLVGRPLLTDRDDRDGMRKLFVEGKHYLGYNRQTFADLEDQMKYMINNPAVCQLMADEAYNEVKRKHQVFNRAETILETIF